MISKARLARWLDEQGLTGLARDIRTGKSSLLDDMRDEDHPLYDLLMRLEQMSDELDEMKVQIANALKDM